jgi:hypothetical protein
MLSYTNNYFFTSYRIPLQYPLLDSFPNNMFPQTTGEDKIDVHTTLFTDKSVANTLRSFRSQVIWSVDSNEREDLSNGISEFADAYEEDWSSGSDEDDDAL